MLDGRLHRPPHLYATVRVAILAGILFLSGIGSLIFETLWLRLSGLSVGNSVWAVASLRGTGAGRSLLWLHNCLRPSASGRVDAARLANAMELSADAHWIAFCPVIPYSVDTDNGDGPDTAGIGGRSDFAARKFRASDRFSLWIEHVRRGSRSGRW